MTAADADAAAPALEERAFGQLIDTGGPVPAREMDNVHAAEPEPILDAAEPEPAIDPLAVSEETVEHLAAGRSADVRPDDPWAEAGRKVLRFHLARMLARVPGVLSGEDAEDVHAMRVASRRMRAAWRVFGDGFERETGRRYRRDLSAIGSRLGAVRDLDVLIEILVRYGERRSTRERSRLQPLRDAWRAERGTQRAALAAYLGSTDFASFAAEYDALVTTDGMDAVEFAPHAANLVRQRMPAVLWRGYGDVWAWDRLVADADIATLHELRIAGKWLRYTLEFIREPLGPEATRLIQRVVAIQDHIGTLHDMHVASGLAASFAADTSGLTSGERLALGHFEQHLDRGAERLRRSVGTTWKPVAAAGYRRALGRALARL